MHSHPNDSESWKASFPKTRPELPREYQRIYESEYLQNRDGEDLVSAFANSLESWMHRKAAASYKAGNSTLELGAGTLNHLDFEPSCGGYDIVEPFQLLYEGRENLSRIGSCYSSVHDIPDTNSYDRVISVAVLEHILDLPAVVARAGLLMAERGTFTAGIPTEGGLLWYLAWRVGTGIPFYIKHGMDYGPYMRHEHVNSAREIESVLRFFFSDVSIERHPLNLFHASFYTHFTCRRAQRQRCEDYLHEGTC